MLPWKQHGCDNPVYTSECGLFVIMRSPRLEIIAKRYDFPDDRTPAETSGPLASVEAAKKWCLTRRPVPTFTI